MTLQEALNNIDQNLSSELKLSRSNIDNKQVSLLFNALINNKSFTILDISYNRIGDVGAQALANLFEINHSLKELDISKNQVADAGAQALAKALETNYTLNSLNLWNNQVGDVGAQALAKALEVNNSLNLLNLWNNKVSNAGTQALAKALATNYSLNCLDIGFNQVGDIGVQALAKVLETNHSLTTLNLSGNQVSDTGAQALAKALETNHSLNSLDVGGNQINDTGAQALAKALETNHSLNTLYLNDNKVGDAGAKALAKVLVVNHSLNNLNLDRNQVGNTVLRLFDAAPKTHETRCQSVQKAAKSGNEQELTTYFNHYQQFPPVVLSLLIQFHYEDLVMRWESHWSIAALNYRDYEDNTPLHHAIKIKADNLISWLLTKPVSLNQRNKENQSPLDLLESFDLLKLNEWFQLGTTHFLGQEEPNNRMKARYYCEKALKKGYKPAIWLLNLLNLLSKKNYIELVSIDKLTHITKSPPELASAEIQTLIFSIATPEGKLLSSLTQQDYTLYHLTAYLGSIEWIDILKIASAVPKTNLLPQLILMKNRQGLRPSALARQQAKFIAEYKEIKFNSPEATRDEILNRYRVCEVTLRQIEEKTQLDLILLNQRNQQKVRLDYEERAQALKDNINSLRWQPENVSENFVTQYAHILQQIWRAKQTCIILRNQFKKELKWPEEFNPFELTSPGQTLNQLIENSPSSRLSLQYKLKGSITYINYQYECALQWLKFYESNVNIHYSEQEAYSIGQIALNQLINAYQSYKNLWKKASSDDDKEWLLSTPILILQAGKKPAFITPSTIGEETLSPAAKLSYFLNKGERIEGMAGAGTAPVFSIRGVHYKRNPHAPGIEFMVSSLGKVLAGEGATPTELMKVIGPDGIPYAYQASHTVQGKDLQSVLIHHPECIDKIRVDNFAAVVVLGMLTDPQDGKPDNYMVEFIQDAQGNITQIDILGIDNDIAFSDVVISQHKEGEKAGQYMMNIKNALYFFPQMMLSIDAGFRDKLLEKQPEFILLEWLQLLLTRNREYETLLSEGIFTLTEYAGDGRISKRGLQLPIKMVAGTMARVYRKLKQLNEILNKEPDITLWNLLMKIEPEVATHYAKVKAQYPHEHFGCDVMECITALYEENVSNGKELMWFRAQLDAGYTHTMTSLVLKTAEEFGFEDNRTTSLKDSVINVLKCLAYEDFKGMLAPVLYKQLSQLIKISDLEEFLLLTNALAHNCTNCVYWLWQESLIEFSVIQQVCENLKKYSLLHFFAQNKHLNGVQLLVTQSVYAVNICNSQGYTPLHMAASVGDIAIVEYLVENKAYVNAKTTLGKTALMMAENRCKQMNEQSSEKGDNKYADIIAYLTRVSTQPIKRKNNKSHTAIFNS